MRRVWLLLTAFPALVLAENPVIPGNVNTSPFASYDEAPATVDADDPAIWVHPERSGESLVIGTLKDAGLVVYDLRGRVVQLIAPPNLPTVLQQDPPTPVGVNLFPPNPCAGSEGVTFGRFNNVDVAYGVKIGHQRRDIAVVTDRGCDRLRVYSIDPARTHAPLTDITAADAPRLYPWRVIQPSPVQPGELDAGLQANPIDEQDTGYGVGLWQDGDDLYAFVSQRNRSAVQQFRLFVRHGRVSYAPVRAFLFNPNFTLREPRKAALGWTPCRENANEDPQSEGIVVDAANGTLYVAFETIGVYRIPLSKQLPLAMRVGREYLFEPVKSFGQSYWAIPDDEEFECSYAPEGEAEDGTIVAAGSDAFAGENLEVDVEGLAIYETGRKTGYLLVSSQGDNTFHVYQRRGANRHLGTFEIQDTGDSDGVALTSQPLGRRFPAGLLAVQNGEAEDPDNTDDINGYEYDGSTQFRFVDWAAISDALDLD